MSSKLRRLSGKEVLKALAGFGFEAASIRGSHVKVRRMLPDGSIQTLTVPLNKELDRGTLSSIYRQATQFIPENRLKPFFFHR
jgi:predicted RNA binding protein YcfA (HicA-like mRNA interferase family)